MSSKRRRPIMELALRLALAGATVGALGALAVGVTDLEDLGGRTQLVSAADSGYWLVGARGGVFAYGDAAYHGGLAATAANPVVAMAGTASGKGYWVVTSDGRVSAFGDAAPHGDLRHLALAKPIVGLAPTPGGGGYWLVASDGGIFAFGDAGFFGSMGGKPLNRSIVGMTASPTGNGYWFVASDGGIFAFGDAGFFGSMGGKPLNRSIVGMTASPTGRGYWFVASDGGIFAFGDAGFFGSMGAKPLNRPIVGMTASPTGNGYWFVASDGGTFGFGDASFHGSGVGRGQTIVGMAPANALPVATPDAAATDEDTPVSIDVLANDRNLADSPISLSIESGPASGVASVEGGRVLYRPVADFFGTDHLAYRVTDADGDSSVARVTLSVRAVNDQPALSRFGAASIDEDGEGTWAFSVSDPETSSDSLVVTVRSSDPALVPDSNLSVTGSGSRRSVTARPLSGRNGTATISVSIYDGSATTTERFALTVKAVNDPPTISSLSRQTIAEDSATAALAFSVSDPESAASTLEVSATSSNQTLVTQSGIAFGGSGTSRTVRLTPAPNASGSSFIVVTVSDGSLSASEHFEVIVSPVNDAPVTAGLSVTTNEDTASSATVTGSDVDGDALAFALGTGPSKGSATVGATTGAVTYTPAQDRNGADSFTVLVSDGHGGTATSTVSVSITAVNDAPVTAGLSVTTNEDTASNATVTGSDVDGDALAFALGTGPSKGSATVGATTGAVTYTPAQDRNGADSFTVVVSDGHGGTATSTISVSITAVNDAPVTAGLSVTTNEDTASNATVTGSDVDGDALAFALGTGPSKGSATVGATTGAVTYTPAQDRNGADSFTVVVSDGHGGSATSTISVSITAVNDAPVGADATLTTTEDAGISGTLTGSDAEGDTLSFAIARNATKGSATVNAATGAVTYTPAPDANGTDTFSFTVSDGSAVSVPATVTVTVGPVDDLPHAIADAATTDEDTAITIAVLANDTGTGDHPLVVSVTSAPASGSPVANANGTVTYTPPSEWAGAVSFTYSVRDANGDTSAATVNVTVRAVNDTPTVGAINDVATSEDQATPTIDISVADVDTSAASLTLSATSSDPAKVGSGGFAFGGTGTSRSLVVTPKPNANGTATITVTVSDGSTSASRAFVLSIAAVNDLPVVNDTSITTAEDTTKSGTLSATDADDDPLAFALAPGGAPARGTITVDTDGAYTYSPAPDANGTDSFTVTVSDGHGGTDTALVTVNVTAVNDTPVAAGATLTTAEDTAANGTVSATDADGDPLTYEAVASPAHGTVTIAAGGAFTYTPTADWNGTDGFTFRARDAASASPPATVTVTVTSVDDLPAAAADAAATNEDAAVSLNVLANDTGLGDGGITVSITTQPASGGTAAVNPDRTVTFTPAPDFAGTATFTYTVGDASGQSSSAQVTVTVTPVNDSPTLAAIGAASTDEDTATAGVSLTVGDIDTPSGNLTLSASASPALVDAGGFSFSGTSANRTLVISPKANANGTTTVTVTVSDGALSATRAFTFTIRPVQDAPTVADQGFSATEDAVFSGVLTGADADGDSLSFAILTPPAHGTISGQAIGTFTYTPAGDYYGTDTFTLSVTDGIATAGPATATVTIANVNDAPVAVSDAVRVQFLTGGDFYVRANDIDIDDAASTLAVQVTSGASRGTVLCGSDGHCSYTPTTALPGTTDSFTYRLTDPSGASSGTTVTITVE